MQKAKPEKKRNVIKAEKVNRKPRMIPVMLSCLLIAGASLTVYSKYYKTGYNQGMAIASGFYFSSNYMHEEEGLENVAAIKELAKNGELVNRLISAASNGAWNVGSYSFSIDVCNYANQLLYNDEDLNIDYKVEFILLDPGTGGRYEVRKGDGSFKVITDKDSASFTGRLEGGRLSADKYELRVSLTSGSNDYTPARILAMAYPDGQNTKKIAGVLEAVYNEAKMQIIDQKFTIEDDLDLAGTDWKERAREESAFVYQLKTTGGYYVDGSDNMLQKIKIEWDPDLFVLSQNDRYLNAGSTVTDNSEGKKEMIIETVPYSSIKFVFFKKETFSGQIGGMTLEKFKETVKAEIVE